jgi:hypothetical protein
MLTRRRPRPAAAADADGEPPASLTSASGITVPAGTGKVMFTRRRSASPVQGGMDELARQSPGRAGARVLTVGVAGALVAASLSAAPVSARVRLGAGPAATTARPGAQRTMAVAHPRVSSHALAPARALGPAVTTFNPATGSQGFGVFVQGNAALGATAANGPVAMGGNLAIGSNFTVASQTAGTFTASGDAHPAGLLVGGSINWSGSNSGGALNVGSKRQRQGGRHVRVGHPQQRG